ncbi:MAG: MauE/DoxX family redox-associated membrane protein [Bacteroidia bacterium]
MKRFSVILMGLLYISAGVYHFIDPGFYLKIMPSYIPFHLFMIYLSGIIEIFLGILLFIKRSQKIAGWLIILMLLAFLPVHYQMLVNGPSIAYAKFWLALVRLPLQFILMYWTYKACSLKFKMPTN